MALMAACPSPGPGFLPHSPPPQNGTWLWPAAQLKEKVSLAACQRDPEAAPSRTVIPLKVVPFPGRSPTLGILTEVEGQSPGSRYPTRMHRQMSGPAKGKGLI